MTNKKDGTLYTGVTNNLRRRIGEHKSANQNLLQNINLKILFIMKYTLIPRQRLTEKKN